MGYYSKPVTILNHGGTDLQFGRWRGMAFLNPEADPRGLNRQFLK
jgi:hypothetical protein